jgi:NAD-dependent SIR2 family protein deacetylase
MKDFDRKIETLAQWMYASQYLVVFTGAGISTESGLSDFRGPDGVWTRRDRGLEPLTPTVSLEAAQPNIGHNSIVEIQNLGRLKFLISQNVDNLHLKSGIKPELLAELHGNISKLRCRRCEQTFDHNQAKCPCGGSLTSSVVDFGQSLPKKDLFLAYKHSRQCDLFIVLGSSLVVTPAAEMPTEALNAGAKLVIINQGDTPFDRYAHLRFHEQIGTIFTKAVKKLKGLMGLFE